MYLGFRVQGVFEILFSARAAKVLVFGVRKEVWQSRKIVRIRSNALSPRLDCLEPHPSGQGRSHP